MNTTTLVIFALACLLAAVSPQACMALGLVAIVLYVFGS